MCNASTETYVYVSIEMETLVQGTERGSTITQNETVLIPFGISGPYFF